MSASANSSDSMNPIGVLKSGYYQDAYNPDGLTSMHTVNEKVDIVATGYDVFDYSQYTNNAPEQIGSGTSYAAPMVSGTIGLMLSLDECLIPNEIESILKLTSKDIETMNLNTIFRGYVGAGKLEIGNAVKFVNEMIKPNGNSVIENHIFNRFNFLLPRINNQLTIKNVTFKESSSASFIARNSIEVSNNSDFIPNASGSIDLKLDSAMNISCSPVNFERKAKKSKAVNEENKSSKIVLHPNPNKGIFTINLGIDNTSLIICNIYDISGKLVYNSSSQISVFDVNLPNIPSGVYIVKLQGDNYNEMVKFIKE